MNLGMGRAWSQDRRVWRLGAGWGLGSKEPRTEFLKLGREVKAG